MYPLEAKMWLDILIPNPQMHLVPPYFKNKSDVQNSACTKGRQRYLLRVKTTNTTQAPESTNTNPSAHPFLHHFPK